MKRLKWAAYLLDVILVTVFALLGRTTHHDELLGPWGSKLWTTAWPFVVALTLGWVVLRVWRAPTASVRSGISLWLMTVALGLALRAASGAGTALPFVLVATATLALELIGWRLIAHVVAIRRTVRPEPTS